MADNAVMKTFTHPAVARARKEAAEECAKLAAEVSRQGGSAEQVRAVIVERFGLAHNPYSDPTPSSIPRNEYTSTLTPKARFYKSAAPGDLILPQPTPAPKSSEKP